AFAVSGHTRRRAAGSPLPPDKLRNFCRSLAFSFSILSRRAITSSSVADRAAPLNETRQRAAHAVPERSLFLMTFSPRSNRIQLPSEGTVMYTKCQREGRNDQLMKYS